jgi:hypothetical protein
MARGSAARGCPHSAETERGTDALPDVLLELNRPSIRRAQVWLQHHVHLGGELELRFLADDVHGCGHESTLNTRAGHNSHGLASVRADGEERDSCDPEVSGVGQSGGVAESELQVGTPRHDEEQHAHARLIDYKQGCAGGRSSSAETSQGYELTQSRLHLVARRDGVLDQGDGGGKLVGDVCQSGGTGGSGGGMGRYVSVVVLAGQDPGQ